MPEWLTPPQIAKQRQLRVGKVLAWIRSGELRAVNCAEKQGGRPRWRVSAESLAAFDMARSNRAEAGEGWTSKRDKGGAESEVTKFF